MSLLNNSPTFSYISATGISVVFNNKLYTVYDFNTNKKFIYWNSDIPNIFRASNVRPEISSNQFIVLINENGNAIEIPNENCKVYFDGNSIENIRDRIWGIYETNEEFKDKFVTIETDIDGIRTTVGELEKADDTIKENISEIEQRADEIQLSVNEVTKNFNDDKEFKEFREAFNGSIIDLLSALGILKSDFNSYSKDNEIITDEKNSINTHINILTDKKNKALPFIDKIIEIAQNKGLSSEKNKVESSKQALENSHNHFINSMNNVISYGIISPSDNTLIIDAFAKYTLRVNELKNECEKVILLGMGGSVIEQFSKIIMQSDKIEQSVTVVENGVKTNESKIIQTESNITMNVNNIKNNLQSQITQNAGNINLKVSKGNVISEINASPESIQINASKVNLTGYATFTSLSTPGQTVIDGGNIISNTITAEHIQGRHFLGVSVTTINDSGRARAVLTGDGINFHSPYAHAGKLSYDSSGSGETDNARDRLWLRSLGGYALKLQSSGDMSIEANGGYTNMWIKANKIAFNIGSGGFWVNNKQIDFNNLKATATFG